jgi:hypothetical protein
MNYKDMCDGCGFRPTLDRDPNDNLRVACSCTEVVLSTPDVWM